MLNKYESISKLKSIDKGILFMLLSAFIGALNGAVAKILSVSMDPIEIVFYRNLLGVMILLYSFKKIPVSIDTSKLHLLFLFKSFLLRISCKSYAIVFVHFRLFISFSFCQMRIKSYFCRRKQTKFKQIYINISIKTIKR